ncbi:MAG: hypothetical protein LUQ59_08785 [Methanothrix sp.]|nr:hypothetical protein [Methanothrix sp.]
MTDSRGFHKYSEYMVTPGKALYALSTLDVLIDVAEMYFKARSIKWDKTFTNEDMYGSGTRDPYARVSHEHKYTGTLTFASFLVDGSPALTTHEMLALTNALTDQEDEGGAVYFDVVIREVPGKHLEAANFGDESTVSTLGFIEALLNCKVDKFTRDFPDKGSIVTSIDFGFSRKIPK